LSTETTPPAEADDQGEAAHETAALLDETLRFQMPSAYTEMDLYRDLVKVFKGTAEGQRVFRVLLSWGHMFRPSAATRVAGPIDPLRLAVSEGERNFALRILTKTSVEPESTAKRPTRARNKPKEV
jgi:hypothetical protein